MKIRIASLVLAAVGALAAPAAFAAACSSYINGATSAELNTDNVKLNTISATDCYGHVLNSVMPGSNSLADVVAFANSPALFGGGWSGILRADSASANDDFGGLNFSITGLAFGTADPTFTLTITDNNLAVPPSVPVTMDLLLTLKVAGETDFYYFNDISLSNSNNGSYTVAITNDKGKFQDLSDISLMGRDIRSNDPCVPGTPGCTPTGIPEPGSLALAGLALLAAGVIRRRRQG